MAGISTSLSRDAPEGKFILVSEKGLVSLAFQKSGRGV
jgi:hypothetical protein